MVYDFVELTSCEGGSQDIYVCTSIGLRAAQIAVNLRPFEF